MEAQGCAPFKEDTIMTMQNLWRPLGLCALAATLWIGAPVQANADVSRNDPGVMLVARNDQQYNGGQGMNAPQKKDAKGLKAAKAPKAAKAGPNGKPAPKKTPKGSAYGKHDGSKAGKAPAVGRPGNKGAHNDQMARPNGKQPKGAKVARPNDKRPGSRPDARAPQRAPQRADGEVTN